MNVEYWAASIFFLMYISLFCIWWFRAVASGEFDEFKTEKLASFYHEPVYISWDRHYLHDSVSFIIGEEEPQIYNTPDIIKAEKTFLKLVRRSLVNEL